MWGPALSRVSQSRHARHAEALRRAVAACLGDVRLGLVDVGAAGEIQQRWEPLAEFLHYTGFEPDHRSREALMRKPQACAEYQILPTVLWSTPGSIPYNLCRKPMCSSVLEPNSGLLARFPEANRYEVIERHHFHAVRMDDLDVARADFVKLDTQGAELQILRGAEHTLGRSLGVEIEVEFQRIYEGQPLFGAIAEFMEQQGFEFIDFVSLIRWERRAFSGYGQMAFGDALFLRPPEYVVAQAPDVATVGRYVAICFAYGRLDLARIVLDAVETPRREATVTALLALEERQRGQRRAVNRLVHMAAAIVPGTTLVPMS